MGGKGVMMVVILCLWALSATTEAVTEEEPGLMMNFYKDTCPQAEDIIREQVKLLYKRHKNTAFSWLRNIFHDCAVESCDASLLLDSTRRELGEKEHDRSFGLRNFRYIEEIKEALERECPGVVSCSDILVLSAREGIEAVGGPHIPLKTGRRDGLKSRTDMLESYLPDHNESISVVLEKFKSIGIDTPGLVALLGSHSVGRTHCVKLVHRLYPEVDPSLNPDHVPHMLHKCPDSIPDPKAVQYVRNDRGTPMVLDNNYYRNILDNKGLLLVDHQLAHDKRTRPIVKKMAKDQAYFFTAKAELAAPEDPSLIQKIEGLNAKTRTNDSWQNASSVVNRDDQESKQRTVNSGNSVVSARNPRTGHASDSKNSLHYNQGDPATNKNAELAAMSGTAISRRSTQQTQGRADPQTKRIVNSQGNDGWQKTTVMSGSSRATLATDSESFREVNVDDSLDTDSIRRPGSGISAGSDDNQRSTMRELARQRAQQRQKEEEERARDQRAKALAKLEELNRRSQVSEEGSVKNMEVGSNTSLSDMPEDPGSYSPALFPSNSGDVHVCSSLERKNTFAAANSLEPTLGSGKNTMQDTRTSTEYANNVGPTQQDNLPRDRDGTALKQKRLGYKQIFDKKTAGSSVATTEVFDVVPSPEVVNEGVSSHNSDMPATSSVTTESTFTKRKNNRNGKKKHKTEETTMSTTRVAVGKEKKSGDESIEAGKASAIEMDLGSVSVPSLDIKVSGDSSEQISSFTNEESQNRAKNNWKSQHLRRTQRNSLVNKPAEKCSGNNAVMWAPIHPQQKADVSTGVGSQNTLPEFGSSSRSQHQGQTSSKSKRVEIERYVAKPIVKEMAEQIVSKNLLTAAPDMSENVNQKENRGGEGTGILQPSGSTAGKSGSPSKSRHGNGRQGKHGREHGSWHQRGSGAPTKALEDGQFVTSKQPIRGTVNYHSSNQTEQIAAKDQTTCNDGWNDGWYITPEMHYSAAEEMEASAVGKDQGMGIHGKQHASRSNKDGGSNYGDPKKANKKDSNKTHMQPSGHGFSQPDFPVASKESRGPGDHAWHTANRTGKYGGRESTRDKTYGSQKKDVAGYEQQGITTEQKMTSAVTQAQSQNRSTNKEVQVEHNPNSMFQKNTGQGRRFGRGHESQGGWGLSAQENMPHHHQRPLSNRDRQKQNVHYEYKPVGSHTYDGEGNREQSKDSSQTEGPRYREKGQGQQRHGGYQQQRGTSGRNTGHGFTGERN